MPGRVTEITSGQEDLTSKGVMELLDLPVDQLPQEAQEALLSIAGVNSLDQGGELDASLEDLKLPQFDADGKPIKAEGGACACGERRPPLVSKVIDRNTGVTKITILYDGSAASGGDNLSVITGLINAAVENDVIDLTVMTCFNNFARSANDTVKVLALINALHNCKAKTIITRAGCLCTLADCALWLAGNDRRIGPMSWVMVKPYKTGVEATMRDVEERSMVMRAHMSMFGEICTNAGLLTEDEVKRLYDDECSISLSFEDLKARVDALKN